MKVIYIGFCGKAGSGKTTACNAIKDIVGNMCLILAWAAELKRIARDEFGWDGKKDPKGRKLLQTIGTECGRMYGGDLFWVEKWQTKVDKFIADSLYLTDSCPDQPTRIFILNDDTRFDSEAQRIKDNGGIMVELVGRSMDLGDNSSHSSEAGVDGKYIDYVIDNSKSMDHLTTEMYRLIAQT